MTVRFKMRAALWVWLLATGLGGSSLAADWPTFQHDQYRSAVSDENLPATKLGLAWVWKSPHAPRPAWAGPAKWDAYAGIRDLSSMRNYDPVFHAAVAGKQLYFGSSVDNSLHCLDTKTGKQLWQFMTNGPVRIAPTIANNKIYFGSDDGSAYCVSTAGALVWKFNPKPDERLVLNNGRLISFWPVRTGVVVEGDTAYFAGSMLPWLPSYMCAVDAASGKPEGDARYVREFKGNNTFEGSLLVTDTQLIVPQGRIAPLLIARDSGKPLGTLDKAGGGCFTLVTADNQIIHGPGNRSGQLVTTSARDRTKLATHPAGKAMIVAGEASFLMRTQSISSRNRKSGKHQWTFSGGPFLAMIAAGDAIFAGGFDEVIALDAARGRQLWRAPVHGKAHGLAVADGALFVSTDEGNLYCFRPNVGTPAGPEVVAETSDVAHAPIDRREPPTDVPEFKDAGLVGRWVFHASEMRNVRGTRPRNTLLRDVKVTDRAGSLAGAILGEGRLERVGDLEVLKLDGATCSVLLAKDHSSAGLPDRKITAEAWVRVDAPQKWGGIVGALQDNGNFERGWVLGYSDNKFSFGINGTEGRDAITYLAAKSAFEKGGWYHVVGTYDGANLKVYVNGELENSATDQQGDIKYPPQAFLEIGAYHDEDEYFRLEGMLHEVRLYKRALTDAEIAAHYEQRRGSFPDASAPGKVYQPAVGPYLQFTDRNSAVVHWLTNEPTPTVLEYSLDGQVETVVDAVPKTQHEVRLTGLKRNRTYTYVIKTSTELARAATSREYECDTFFNYVGPDSNVPKPVAIQSATDIESGLSTTTSERILKVTGVDRGICLVLGIDKGALAYELAKHSRLNVVCVDTDDSRVAAARHELQNSGLYGVRLSAMQVKSLDALPFPDNFANLIVSESIITTGNIPSTGSEVSRLLKPSRGIAYIGQPKSSANALSVEAVKQWIAASDQEAEVTAGPEGIWATIRPQPLEGSGQWTHQYGRADNSAFGGELLGGSHEASQFVTQWIGRPGPRFQPDRNGRKPGPLAAAGRLFAQGLHRIVALDSHNGVILWSVEIPDMIRMNIPRDSSNWCADEENLFVAIRDKCWQLDAATGQLTEVHDVVPGKNTDWQYDWSYVASHDDLLVGSAVKQGSAFDGFWGKADWYDAPHGPQTDKVCSDSLFALNKKTGKQVWDYDGGLVINSTITIGDGRVYLVECRNDKVKASATRRIGMAELWQDQYLVALDAQTGEKYWEEPIDTHDGVTVFSLAQAKGQLIIVSSGGGAYHVYAYDAATGEPGWDHSFGWPGGKHDHGKAMSRPAIAGERLFVRPIVFDLASGKIQPQKVPGGGCGTYACVGDNLVFRADTVTMWNAERNRASSWARLRPGCWLSTIAADGLLLSPEAGGGCSCGNWLETSAAFAPASRNGR